MAQLGSHEGETEEVTMSGKQNLKLKTEKLKVLIQSTCIIFETSNQSNQYLASLEYIWIHFLWNITINFLYFIYNLFHVGTD